jgi:TrmH RNA methyltransferase
VSRKPARSAEPARKAEEQEDRSGSIERKLYGVNACLTFMRLRGDDIIRAYFIEEVARQHFGKLMKLLAETRRAYHIVDADEMQKVTDSTHHEGVCLLVRDAPVSRIGDWLAQPHATTEIVLALEDVGNPHNLGAIMRTAAHFGVAAIMVSGAERLRSGAAMRTAAGGAENVPLLEAAGFVDGLKALKAAGYTIVTTSSHKGQSVFTASWSPRVCIVMGEEQHGVSRGVQALAEQGISIPGTGAVESLNVSVATAIVVAQCAHAQQTLRRTPGTLRKPAAKSK